MNEENIKDEEASLVEGAGLEAWQPRSEKGSYAI
jgi:hypothetical protein